MEFAIASWQDRKYMDDKFLNRLASFTTTLDFADLPEHKAVWENQVPKAFGTKLGQLATEVTALRQWCQKQGASIGGAAAAKVLEERELETAAFELAQALVTGLMDAGRVAEAEPFRRSASWWQGLRDQALLTHSQGVIDAATPLTTGAGAAANAENYGISAARLAALVAQRTDYLAVVSAPAAARSGRKGYTALLREKFLPVTVKFRDLDRLVPQFRARPGGEAFVAGWFAARQVVDAGHGPGTGGGNGGGGPAPTVPGKAQISSVEGDGTATVTLHFDAPGAVTFEVWVRVPGAADFTLAAGDLTEKQYVFTNVAGAPWWAKVAGRNAQGAGPESDEVNFSGPT